MKISQITKAILPLYLKRKFYIYRSRKKLGQVTTKNNVCVETLLTKETLAPDLIFNSHKIQAEWNEILARTDSFDIPDGTGGVCQGDRRAIYYLVRKFNSSSVLEVGTHIGASTIYIAVAMDQSEQNSNPTITSVDIKNVNDTETMLWMRYGMKHSPAEMIEMLRLKKVVVSFVVKKSTDYLAQCEDMYDFIFLDGSHSSEVVYREISYAPRLLKKNGIILLHDYFPLLKPLWSDNSMIPGPYLAVERLKRENANLEVYPLGKLPWRTKLGSNATSLAILCKGNGN